MAPFENTFQWSYSRQRTFDACKRQYYFQYYGRWNGWQDNAPAETRRAYMLSQMTNIPMLVGQLVHQSIAELLASLRGSSLLPLEALQGTAIKRLELARWQSQSKRWRRDPKRHTNLFEDYYGPGVRDLEQAKEHISAALASFYNSDTLATVRDTDPTQCRSLEQLQRFVVEGFPVLVVMDLAVDLDGELVIYDWKTGGAYEGHHEQLACYALYAEAVWGYAPEDVLLRLFYLNQDQIREERASAARRQAAIDWIVTGCRSMQSYLLDPQRNVARKEDFPMTEDREQCNWCFYQELCSDKPGLGLERAESGLPPN